MNKMQQLLADNDRLRTENKRLRELVAQLNAKLDDVTRHARAELTEDQKRTFTVLHGIGVEATVAARLAQRVPYRYATGWTSYAKSQKTLTNPAGLVVARLQQGVEPPKPDNGANERARYAEWGA